MRRIELIKALGDEMLAAMRRIVQPINEKLAALEAFRQSQAVAAERRSSEVLAHALHIEKLQSEIALLRSAVQDIPAGKSGERGEPGPAGAPGRDGTDGKDGAAGPQGERGEKGADGVDGRDGIDGKDGAIGPRGEKGDPGADGRSVTIDDVQPLLDSAIAKALLDLERRNADTIQRAVDLIPRPRDGIDGKDGRDGADGRDGSDGKDGRDAFDLDDMFIEHDGERTVTVGFRRGPEVISKTIKFPVQIDRGVYKIDRGYEQGDGVTYGGDYWTAVRDAAPGEKPGESDAWRLVVRKGRDGRRGA